MIQRNLKNEWTISIIGGLIFLCIFQIAYALIDSNLYEYRDDAVITMSAGKTLADYGFVGVNPSGPIVEASSSPLQTIIYFVTYKITGMDYALFSYLQTMISSFFLGAIFIRFFYGNKLAILCTLLGAVLLTCLYPFFLWHGSGMENSLTHVLFLAAVYGLYKSDMHKKVDYSFIFIVFLATIVRVEAVFYIAALLVFFSIYWFFTVRNLDAFVFSIGVFILWMCFCILRWWYFGDLLPNTAYAQKISISDRMNSLFNLEKAYLVESLILSIRIFIWHGGILLPLFIPAFLCAKKQKQYRFVNGLCLMIFFLALLTPFIFGRARIEPWRTTTYMAVFIILYMMITLLSLEKIKAKVFMVFSLAIIFIGHLNFAGKPYYLGWSTKGFNEIRNRFGEIAADNDIHRPTISNPDLGVMTWYKQFNVIDLGMLGSPVMARLENGPAISNYYLNYALPDIVEAHGVWTDLWCESIFSTPQFHDLYRPLLDGENIHHCVQGSDSKVTFWIRRDIEKGSHSAERILLDDLQKKLDPARIKSEIDSCQGKAKSCRYIARTVYKFIPELRQQELFDGVFALFIADADKALLEGWRNPDAANRIIKTVLSGI